MSRFWWIFFAVVLFVAGSVVMYVRQTLQPVLPTQAGLDAMVSGTEVAVQEEKYGWSFQPKAALKTGLAFYPGGLINPVAYAPLMKEIAKGGYRVALLRVPYNLATSAQGRAREAIEQHPELKWAVGGHSLGGVVALNFGVSHPEVKAVVMWAAYPQGNQSGSTLPTLALFGSQDGVIGPNKIKAQQSKFPQATHLEVLEGLNHASFGAYGPQRGDREALISKEAGWTIIVKKTLGFLDQHLKN